MSGKSTESKSTFKRNLSSLNMLTTGREPTILVSSRLLFCFFYYSKTFDISLYK
jgi:hypothetical protein